MNFGDSLQKESTMLIELVTQSVVFSLRMSLLYRLGIVVSIHHQHTVYVCLIKLFTNEQMVKLVKHFLAKVSTYTILVHCVKTSTIIFYLPVAIYFSVAIILCGSYQEIRCLNRLMYGVAYICIQQYQPGCFFF